MSCLPKTPTLWFPTDLPPLTLSPKCAAFRAQMNGWIFELITVYQTLERFRGKDQTWSLSTADNTVMAVCTDENGELLNAMIFEAISPPINQTFCVLDSYILLYEETSALYIA